MTQGLHRYALTQAAAPTDETELAQQARALIPARTYTSRPLLVVAVAAGPAQQVIRPAELESEQLRRYLQDEAHAGTDAVLSHSFGTALRLQVGDRPRVAAEVQRPDVIDRQASAAAAHRAAPARLIEDLAAATSPAAGGECSMVAAREK